MTVIFVVFLSGEFGYSDEDAGMLYGLWGTIAAAWGVFMSPAVDSTGVKAGLLVGFVTTAISRLILVMTADHMWVYVGVLVVSPIGMGLADPVFLRSLRLYTNDANRSMIFGFYYSCSNLGIAVGAWLRDLVVLTSPPEGVALFNVRLSRNRMVLLIGAAFACFGCGMAALLRTAPAEKQRAGSHSVNGVPEDEALLLSGSPSDAPSVRCTTDG
jgi:MFS family permease